MFLSIYLLTTKCFYYCQFLIIFMDKQYCLNLPDAPRPKSLHDFIVQMSLLPEPYTLILDERKKPVLFGSLEDAIQGAEDFKREKYADHEIEVREYYGESSYVHEIISKGDHKVGTEILRKV